jgi:hypothetical protein
MEPRPGRTYATIYYQQTLDQRNELLDHVRSVIGDIMRAAQADPEDLTMLQQPLPGFRRTHQANYSAVDIMNDMLTQLEAGRDITQGLLGRWNRLFGSTPAEIDIRHILED